MTALESEKQQDLEAVEAFEIKEQKIEKKTFHRRLHEQARRSIQKQQTKKQMILMNNKQTI